MPKVCTASGTCNCIRLHNKELLSNYVSWIFAYYSCSVIYAVTLHPSDRLVVVPGGNVTFTCVSQESILSIQWLVNSSSFEDFNLTNVMSEFTLDAGGIGALNFFNLIQEYNNTSIQCIATLSSGQDSSSRETILLLQGIIISE